MRSTISKQLILLTFYLFLAIFLVCPTIESLNSTLPVENERLGPVALFNLWTIWWNSDRAVHGFSGYWDAPIFFPERSTFAFSEPQPATLLVAPVIWITGSRVLAYKAYLLLSLVLNGFLTAILLDRKTGFWIAVAGGAAMLLLPAVHLNIGVLQLVPIWGVLWTWDASYRLSQRPSLWRGTECGLAFSSVWMTSMHHGLFLTLLLVFSVWLMFSFQSWRCQRFLQAACLALLVIVCLVGPFAWKIHSAAQKHEFIRDQGVIQSLSAQPMQYCYTSGRIPLSLLSPPKHTRTLSPGWIKLTLASACLLILIWRRKFDRWVLFLLLTGVVGVLLSLGPNLKIADWEPWWILVDWVPGFAQVRSVYRFSYFVQISVVLLAMQGLRSLWIVQRRMFSRGWSSHFVRALLICLGVGAAFESIPVRPMLVGVPDETVNQKWIEFIRQKTPASKGIACFPFSAGHLVEDFDVTARWMYYGTFHQKPMVNGYSGFFPDSYKDLKEAVNKKFPSQKALQALQSRNVEFVVVSRNSFAAENMTSANTSEVGLYNVIQDPVGVDVYQIRSAREVAIRRESKTSLSAHVPPGP